MKTSSLAIVSVMILAGLGIQSASAEDTSSGCGLGWQVSQRQSLLSSMIRHTTNTILPNTFSMTSGTSGCAKHDIVQNDEKAVEYAVNNYDSLLVEMAEGHGEFLHGFAQALGCKESDFSRFETFAQIHYKEIVESSTHDGIELYRSVRTELESTPEFQAQCVPTG